MNWNKIKFFDVIQLNFTCFIVGRRNPLRMLSNAMDFRSRKRGAHRPKSADFERVNENPAGWNHPWLNKDYAL